MLSKCVVTHHHTRLFVRTWVDSYNVEHAASPPSHR